MSWFATYGTEPAENPFLVPQGCVIYNQEFSAATILRHLFFGLHYMVTEDSSVFTERYSYDLCNVVFNLLITIIYYLTAIFI